MTPLPLPKSVAGTKNNGRDDIERPQAKLHVDLRNGIVDIEGDQAFVEKVFVQFQDELKRDYKSETPPGPQGDAVRGWKHIRWNGGPSCAERITKIRDEGLLSEKKNAAQIRDMLGDQGMLYTTNQVTAALGSLARRGELRRIKVVGQRLCYSEPSP